MVSATQRSPVAASGRSASSLNVQARSSRSCLTLASVAPDVLATRCHNPSAAVPRSRIVASESFARSSKASATQSLSGSHQAVGTVIASSRSRLRPG